MKNLRRLGFPQLSDGPGGVGTEIGGGKRSEIKRGRFGPALEMGLGEVELILVTTDLKLGKRRAEIRRELPPRQTQAADQSRGGIGECIELAEANDLVVSGGEQEAAIGFEHQGELGLTTA